ncbi:PP2C family protein-serine/threonine phosphatase, partial [Cyanobium gracile]
ELNARVRSGLRLYESSRLLRVISQDLADQKRRLEDELSQAADYVRSILPPPMEGDVTIDRLFLPSSQLGGDCLDFYWLDEQHLVLYILDVSGHGLAAALPSISIHNLLRTQARFNQQYATSHGRRQSDSFLKRPADVLNYLNSLFQMKDQNNQYFTIWYGVFDKDSRQLRYASAGHPPALLRSMAEGGNIEWCALKAPGMPIGLFEEVAYEERTVSIGLSSQLFLYTDGLYEIPKPDGEMWDNGGFQTLLEAHAESTESGLVSLVDQIRAHTSVESFPDDASIISIHFTPSPDAGSQG